MAFIDADVIVKEATEILAQGESAALKQAVEIFEALEKSLCLIKLPHTKWEISKAAVRNTIASSSELEELFCLCDQILQGIDNWEKKVPPEKTKRMLMLGQAFSVK